PAPLGEIGRLADACTRGGMPTAAVADARGPQWRKVIFNASTNPVGALTGLTHGRVCERPDLRQLVSGLVDEGKAVAAAQEIELDADPEDLIDHAAKPEVAYDHKASMLQDVEARRTTEIDYLNGGIVRFVGEHGDSEIADQQFVDRPGEWLAGRLRGKRVGVYGMDYVMTVRDFAALDGAAELVPWDLEFDHARAVKSDAELESVRDSVRINADGFHAFREAYASGRTAAEVMAPAERLFVERGCGRLTMNMVLGGAEVALARR